MADDSPKAEFHDIGKLINWAAHGLRAKKGRGEPHEFEACVETDEARRQWGVSLRGRAWRNIVRKDAFRQLRDQTWPNSIDWLLASHADNLAAGFGRAIPENLIDAEARQGRHCLWTGLDWDEEERDPSEQPQDPRLSKESDIREMIRFLNADPSWDEAELKYGEFLLRRAETARPGLNVTTLLSHCRVVGQLARVLSKRSWETPSGGSWRDDGEPEGHEIPLWVGLYEVGPAIEPYRSRDATVFAQLNAVVREVSNKYPDNVLAAFGTRFVVADLVENGRSIEEELDALLHERRVTVRKLTRCEAVKRYLNFCNSCERVVRNPRELQLTDDGVKHLSERGCGGNVESFYIGAFPDRDYAGGRTVAWNGARRVVRQPPDRIEEPICEVCKMAHATRNWLTDAPFQEPGEEGVGREDLCEECFNFRCEAQPLPKLSTWRTGALVWIYFDLDFLSLRESLNALAREYLKAVPWKQGSSESQKDAVVGMLEVSLPVVVDFVEDYKHALGSVRDHIVDFAGSENVEELMEGLLCVRLQDIAASDVVFLCLERLRRAFPRLCAESVEFPVRTGFSVSSVKHPFFDHWRFFRRMREEVEIQLVNSGTAKLKIRHVEEVRRVVDEAAEEHRSSLHNLAVIAAHQPSLAQLALLDKSDRGLGLGRIGELLACGKLNLASARVLANLTRKGGEDG